MIGWLRDTPRLGVGSGRPTPPELVNLLAVVRKWCTIVPLSVDSSEVVDAVLTVGTVDLPAPPTRLAVWADSIVEVEQAHRAGAAVILSVHAEVIERAGVMGLLVPPGLVPEDVMAGAVPVAPFVRSRLRGARGLPSPLVIEHDNGTWHWSEGSGPLDGDLGVTAIGCASAAVVVGSTIIEALAWGTPCVTDSDTAAAVGARPESEVLVADDGAERRRRAAKLAADGSLAARLSWAGRILVETRHSPALVAARLVRRLGLGAASSIPGPPSLAAQLADLDTPEGAVIMDRVRSATKALSAKD